jgi:ubiquinone/menaquinone biosynthesis C-methylase UbiE
VSFYEQKIFPWVMELSMRGLERLRSGALERARGEVLEVGFGTGLNLRHYPEAVRSLVALDPLDVMRGRVERRIAEARFPVERTLLAADGTLPFESDRFDCVVTTWTLCTIARAEAALEEMRRVLRPGGLYLFIEHGRSDDPGVARWQARLNPLQQRLGCGCTLDREIDALVRKGGFEIQHLDRFVFGGPRILSTMYKGAAR